MINSCRIRVQAVSLMVITAFLFSGSLFAQAPTADSLSKKGRDTITVGALWIRSTILPGYGQIYNKDYYKIPVFYGSAAALIYFGYQSNLSYQKAFSTYNQIDKTGMSDLAVRGLKQDYVDYRDQRNLYYFGAGMVYLSSVLDAVSGHPAPGHSPAKATIYSTLVPGLGQIYNKKYWKVPVIYSGLVSMAYLLEFNNRQYNKYRTDYNLATDDNTANDPVYVNGYKPSSTLLKNYRDSYRRNRDLSVIVMLGVYALNIIDANVDANFYDFDIGDNLALKVEPMVNYAINTGPNVSATPIAGFNFAIRF